MTRWWLAPEAAEDLERLVDFLAEAAPETAGDTVDLILDALDTLSRHPNIGRPMQQGLRELVISRGRSGYLALYSYDEQHDAALVLAIRHQREDDYH
jgi:plasmid stabilization system protein ParE